jgi:carbon monoxide dehydrogenase subunit G
VAEVQHQVATDLPAQAIWDFVRDIDHWAALLTGYQSHRKENEDDSVWVLKGDLGAMTRRLEFRVHVTEWAGPERVRFEIQGLNEQMTGSGEFLMSGAAAAPEAAVRKSLFERIAEWLVRLVWRKPKAAVASRGETRLSFRLQIRPGGPMGPMVDAMVKPAMAVAAEDLAQRIVAHLEREGMTHDRV